MTNLLDGTEAVALLERYREVLEPWEYDTLAAVAQHYPNPYPTRERLAQLLGTSQRTVGRRLAALGESGKLGSKRFRTGREHETLTRRWIALPGFPIVEDPIERTRVLRAQLKASKPVPAKVCARLGCGKTLQGRRSHAETCSAACREAVRRARRSAPGTATKTPPERP